MLFRLIIRLLQRHIHFVNASLQQKCFRLRQLGGSGTVPAAQQIVRGHAFLHILHRLPQTAARAQIQSQNTGRAEGPDALLAERLRSAAQQLVGTPVMLAHTGDAVEGQKAQNNLQLAVIIIALTLAERSVALQRRYVPFLDLQHFRHHVQRKHAAHNNQHRLRILPQYFRRTFSQPVEKMLPVLRAHRPVAQLLHCSQQAVKITAAVQPVQRFLVLLLLCVPLPQTTEVHLLLCLRQQAESMTRCLLQHMMTAQSAVGQPDNKGVAFQQSAYRLPAACAVGKGHLLRRKLLRLPHKQQQALLLRRQRL